MEAVKRFGRELKRMTSMVSGAGPVPRIPAQLCHKELYHSIEDQMPKKLFRLQASDERNINDVKHGLVHMSTPDTFNDIYDSEPLFNIPAIKERMQRQITPENMTETIKFNRTHPIALANLDEYDRVMNEIMNDFEAKKNNMIEQAAENVESIYQGFRKEIHCACFSERVDLPDMWAHYADKGKGFATSYKIDMRRVRCECSMRPICSSQMLLTLCPVQYGKKRFDVSDFSHVFLGSMEWSRYPEATLFLTMINSTVYKGTRWAPEKEWRIVGGRCLNKRSKMYLTLQPTEIYLGYDMLESNKNALIQLAYSIGAEVYQIRKNTTGTGYDLVFDQISTPAS